MRVELLTPTPASQLTRMHAVRMLLEEPLRAGTPIAEPLGLPPLTPLNLETSPTMGFF
jgi:hypothetical protein